ncbi:MAG: hypothetical protein H0X03_00670 [Nitrosopumilus sp.]|nr:hypothetical protein [Nitrosopumilus sp.]
MSNSNMNRKMKLCILAATMILTIFSSTFLTQPNVKAQVDVAGSVLKLSNANIAIDIPLLKSYVNGNETFFIATDVSDENTAAFLTEKTGFQVNYAPILANTPDSAKGQTYIFTNGINGTGLSDYQIPVFNAKPGDEGYSPLLQINMVEWNSNASARELKSVEEIENAKQKGELNINRTDIIINYPAIKWEGGSLMIKENKTIGDETAYGGGQVLNIDTEKMVVTMVDHRGWGPDGKSIYYIVTDATPQMPANMMGVSYVPADEQLVGNTAVDLFQFSNGINGTGPMGFQSGIGAANPTDTNYSPMWLISFIEWKDPSQAKLLENINDIASMQKAGLITVTPAMDGKHVVNCPFFDQETVLKHQNQNIGLR